MELKENIQSIISEYSSEYFNLQINHAKTKFIAEPWHKKVTGITINNNKIKTSKTLKRNIRRELYFTIIKNKTNYNKLIGQIAYVVSIEKDYVNKILQYADEICKKNNITDSEIVHIITKMKRKQINNFCA